MTERTTRLWAATAALFLVLALALRGWHPAPRPAGGTASRPAPPSAAAAALSVPPPPPFVRPAPESPSPLRLTAPPSRAALRREVEKNPHVPPHALIAFAASLGPKLDAALRSKVMAHRFFDELSDCVSIEGAADTTRAVCLTNAQVVAEHYPELNNKWERLLRTAGPRVTRLANPASPPGT